MNQERHKIYLAALLHDIGKFYQRADEGFKNSELKDEVRELMQVVCPQNQQGRFGYLHVLWSLQFFNNQKNVFENVKEKGEEVFKDNIFYPKPENVTDNLVNLSIYHHKPNSELQALIQLADCWSSGIDRRKEETFEVADDKELKAAPIKWGNYRYKRVPLRPVFVDLLVKDKTFEDKLWRYPLKPLNVLAKESLFPKKIEPNYLHDTQTLQEEYKELWKQFQGDFTKLPTDSFNGFAESLLYLLEKYTWCIPSSTMDMPNVSLYEHLKTTAAIALCLYDYKQENPDDFKFDSTTSQLSIAGENCYSLLMVCGDLSGIQSFIYDIHNRKAAKSLKGRSFYLQLLTDTIIQKIIKHPGIQVYRANVIYASGGKFYLLLPNTEKVKNALEELEKEIEKQIFKNHKTSLYVCFGKAPFNYIITPIDEENYITSPILESKPDNSKHHLGDLWKAVTELAAQKKGSKFRNLLTNGGFEDFFGKNGHGLEDGGDLATANKEICAVSGEVLSENERKPLNTEDLQGEESDTPVYVSKLVYEQIELGKALKDADYLISHHGRNSYFENRARFIAPLSVDIFHYLLDVDEKKLSSDESDVAGDITSFDLNQILHINRMDIFTGKIQGKQITSGFILYGGNEQAKISADGKEREKYFHELAGYDDEGNELAFKRLGVLRMDVDNLGKIFIKGFPDKYKSFAAYASLSNQLNYFFSGYLNALRNKDEYKNWVNILYSGGDDLFVIGRWDKVADFAAEVRKEFREFVCGREEISLSGGMVLVTPKFPIQKAALMAGEAEEKAKEHGRTEDRNQTPEKNAFCLFNVPISWKNEFDFVVKWRDVFEKWLDAGIITKAFVYKLFSYLSLEQEEKNKETKEKNPLRWRWQLAYNIGRYANDSKRTSEQKDALHRLKQVIFCGEPEKVTNKRSLLLLCVAARWAELLLRNKKEQQ